MLEILIIGGMFIGAAIGVQRRATTAHVRERCRTFERFLETCGFRVMTRDIWVDGPFDKDGLKIGTREFGAATSEMDGWRITYRLHRKAACCRQRWLYRLAQPYLNTQSGQWLPGLGPAVCAGCGRIERDYDGCPEGIGGLLGTATNAFPILEGLTRRDGAYADRALLAALEDERKRLEDRREIVSTEIAQLRARLPELPGDGPFRSLPAPREPGDAH